MLGNKRKRTNNKKSRHNQQADWQFLTLLEGQNLPILTLDPAWHALFAGSQKSTQVKQLERKLTELLKQQGRLNNDNKKMQGQKKLLLSNIFSNMSNDSEAGEHMKGMQKDMVEQINAKVVENEDSLALLPVQIKRVNEELLLETLHCVYEQVDINRERIAVLDGYIENIRADLSRKLLEKQNREEYNHEIFSSLKDLVGMRPIDMYEETRKKKGQ